MTHEAAAATATILYVEDHSTNQELMRMVMRHRPGVRLLIAGLGVEALVAAAAERPDLILLDLHLPDMTGLEILDELRAVEETRAIPVVILSGDTTETGGNATSPGIWGYLTKPVDVRELLSYVDRVLDPRRDTSVL